MAMSFLQATPDTSDLSTYTFGSQNLGAAASNRYIIVCVMARKAGAATTISSVTVGGVSATEITQISNSDANSDIAGMYIAAVPTGTTGDIVVVFGATMVRSVISVYRATDLSSPTPSDFATSTAADPAASLDVPAGGFAIGAALSNSASSATWSGLTEEFDGTLETFVTYTGASDAFVSEQSGLSIVANFASSGSTPVGVFASWALSTTNIKSVKGLDIASVKSINGLAIANVKSINGLE